MSEDDLYAIFVRYRPRALLLLALLLALLALTGVDGRPVI